MHFCFKQGCIFTYLFCFIVDWMSPEFLNMGKEIVAYKVVVFKINEKDFLNAADPCIFSYFFSIPSCNSYKLI